ncbi:MAG: type II secretion system protein GspN [Syntrophorhabdales bacterium]|jgi:type II secretion system protein N
MGKRKVLLFSGAVGWGILVMALVIYLFFPYQKALKIALQNVARNGRAAVSMEGVTMKLMGIRASRILFRPDASMGQTAPFELSKVDIFWNPLSLIKGKVTIYSKAALCEGTLRCTVEGIRFIGTSDPNISLKLDHVNIGKCPEGALPWFKGMSGTLDGVIRKETPIGRPDKETGVFRLTIRGGEIKGLQVKDMPRLIIPYKEIVVEGKIDGPRLNINKLTLTSEVIALSGAGVVQSGEPDRGIDMKLSYQVLSRSFPLQGKGIITVSGSQAAPVVAISAPEAEKPAGAKAP